MSDNLQKQIAICTAARKLVDHLSSINQEDLEEVISFRQRTEAQAYIDPSARRAGESLTATLKMILFFRTEILGIQASPEDQAAAVSHGLTRMAEFLNGGPA